MKSILSFLILIMLSTQLLAQHCTKAKFTNQSQIDSFDSGCTQFFGDLIISDNINNLKNLSTISQINGSLIIEGTTLADLYGLHNLRSIQGDLILKDNPNLHTLNYLYNLTYLKNNIVIDNNNKLTTLSGLDQLYFSDNKQDVSIIANNALYTLEGLGNISQIDHLELINNYALLDLTGLKQLTKLNYLKAEGNYSIKNFNGLQKITSVHSLFIEKNRNLRSFEGLNNLTVIKGWFALTSNIKLKNLSGLGSLTKIESSFQIDQNTNLTSFQGLNSLYSVGRNLNISGNRSLLNLQGLEKLNLINGDLVIYSNQSLLNINSLSRLSSINGDLVVNSNISLTNLSGLDNVNISSIERLDIQYNNALQLCNTAAVCTYLSQNQHNAFINQNNSGCDSRLDILSACDTPITQFSFSGDALRLFLENNVTAYVNPVSKTLNIEINTGSSGIDNVDYLLTNADGLILERGVVYRRETIDVSRTPSSMFFLYLKKEDQIIVKRLVF